MECIKCKKGKVEEVLDELVCSNCGAAYCLEYLGMYEEGSGIRRDEGFEPQEWKDKYLTVTN